MAEALPYDALYKIALIGDSNVGKSTLMFRFVDPKQVSDSHVATIGVQFKVMTLPLHSGRNVKLQLWDTGGQERFRAVSNSYYRGARAVIFTFDLTSRASFDHIRVWYNEVQDHHPDIKKATTVGTYDTRLEEEILHEQERLQAPILHLVGNKSDLTDSRTVTYAEGAALAETLGMMYQETSAKIGTGVFDTFLQLATSLDKHNLALTAMANNNEKRILSKSSIIDLSMPRVGEGSESNATKKGCAC